MAFHTIGGKSTLHMVGNFCLLEILEMAVDTFVADPIKSYDGL